MSIRRRLRGAGQAALVLAVLAAILGLINHGVSSGGAVPWVVGPLMTALGAVEAGLGAYRVAKPWWRTGRWASDNRLLAFIVAPPFPAPTNTRAFTERLGGGVQLLLGIFFLAIGIYELGLAV